jgi:hypothetical protein
LYLHLTRSSNKIMIQIDNKRMTHNLFKNQREKPNKKETLKLPEVHQALWISKMLLELKQPKRRRKKLPKREQRKLQLAEVMTSPICFRRSLVSKENKQSETLK